MTMLPALQGSSRRQSSACPAPWGTALKFGVPALLLAVSGLAIALDVQHTPGLAASSAPGQDSDGDGLKDLQEEILGTNPDIQDTDGDGFSDLEEICRQADPLNKLHWPGPNSPKVGLIGRTQGGSLTVVYAIYVEGGALGSLGFEFGIVYGGVPIPLELTDFLGANQIAFLPAANPSDKLIVIETTLPEFLIYTYGPIAFYGAHLGDAISARFSASALNLEIFGGVITSIESAPMMIQGGDGIVHRPLVADDGVPSDWTGGQICWQTTSIVGINGSSIVYEVESAGCEQMDTYCSPSECAATVGGSIELVDPGSLIGG